ncbi:hypothetical protein J2X06_000020 [Lysobacter niastensis]|uniref:DUF3185 family protein n=1 Tax=Lysobacter niastensis TaxID=380629 RepID=A0ABU1W5H9_9GAMM|nr:hypothetical protein [Lysobacter niastensis]MDR7132836.1 hypothetical protein [Lysobacter niastensis]
MRKVLEKLACIALLLVVAGFSTYALLGGLITGAIDGPARGADEIKVALNPLGFWLMAAAYLVGAVLSSVAAYRFTQDA